MIKIFKIGSWLKATISTTRLVSNHGQPQSAKTSYNDGYEFAHKRYEQEGQIGAKCVHKMVSEWETELDERMLANNPLPLTNYDHFTMGVRDYLKDNCHVVQ